jgi:mono/diheme cytochrome c family protein
MRDRVVVGRQRMLAACLATACAALVATGCGDSGDKKAGSKPRTPPRPAVDARLAPAGQKVFARYCGNCHTIGDRISRPDFVESPIPNFNEVKPKPDYIRARVEGGGIDMPSLTGELSRAQIQQVIAYVYTASGRDVEAGKDPNASLSSGEQLFRANCQACHAIAGRPMTGRPPYPGTDMSAVRPSAELVMRLVRRGIPDEMPSFRGKLTDTQIRAVAAYVTSAAGR